MAESVTEPTMDQGVRVSQATLQRLTEARIPEAYEAGTPVDVLAQGVGLTPAALWSALRALGVQLRGSPSWAHARAVLTEPWLRQRWVDEQRSINSIAREAGVQDRAVTEALARFDLIRHRPDHPACMDPEEQAHWRQLYRTHGTIPAVATAAGISSRTARLKLILAGVDFHPPGRRRTP